MVDSTLVTDDRIASSRPPARDSSLRARVKGRPSKRSTTRPTIGAVAQRAEVAISTVSRVLNGGSASAAIRQRVERAIEELGYVPSVAAQSLVSRRTGCIGLAVNSTQGPWFSEVIAGVEEALAPSRCSLLLGSMRLTGTYDPSAVSAWIQERRVDGLIFVRYSRRERPLFTAASRAGLPVVLLAPDLQAPADYIARCNNFEAGWLVAHHLAELGHQRISFAGGPSDSQDTRHRLEGLCDGLKECGHRRGLCDVWFGRDYYARTGVEYADRLLEWSSVQRPSAVVLGSDAMALGFMGAVARRGLRIPEQLSVVGFDGVAEGELACPRLTSAVQPTRSMAASACRVLLERVQHPEQNQLASVEFRPELVVRESTAKPPSSRSTS